MTALVILPGLDGTTALLSAFATEARRYFAQVTVVAYPSDRSAAYAELEQLVWQSLPQRRFVLLGESFSGPIALLIAAQRPAGLAGLVLSTTFSRNPVPVLAPFAALTRLAPAHRLPMAALRWSLLGRWSTPALETQLIRALRRIAPAVLRERAASALRVDVSARLGDVAVPTLYLRASHDRLMHRSAGTLILAGIAGARCIELPGPHLLLQTAPAASARAIADWLDTVG
ncbi:pimeloyl-ACP methyl ester carboxylesterase [Xanthomonas translucens]